MDKRYLEYILVLAETGNMTRAANKLFISQPTLSQFLSKQEQALGSPLFQRSHGTYSLTPVGELYAEYARKVLFLTNTLEKDIQRISATSTINIATSATRSLQVLTAILGEFRQLYPKIEINLSDSNLSKVTSRLTTGELDMAFVTLYSLDPYKNCCVELKKEEVVFAIPSDHPFAKAHPECHDHGITSKDVIDNFKDMPFILQLKGSCIRHLIASFFEEYDFSPIVACNTSHAQSICDMVISKIGVAFVPSSHAIQSSEITLYSLEPKMYRIHSILFRKDLILMPAHKCLIRLAQKYVEDNWKDIQ